MKIKLILTAIAFAVASYSFAQTDQAKLAQDIEQNATELTEEMTTYLDLDENQVLRMKSMNMNMLKQKEAMKSMNLSDSEMSEKVKAYEERHNSTVKQVLSEEQYKKFEKKYGMMKMEKREMKMEKHEKMEN